MTDDTLQVLQALLGTTGVTGHVVDRARQTMLLRWAADHGVKDEAVQLLMARRREQLRRVTLRQRDWQARVSRRPARRRHHDSWTLREQYVRV